MKQITMSLKEYENDLFLERESGHEEGYEKAFNRLLELIESDMSEEAIKEIFEWDADDRFYAENVIISWVVAKSTSCDASSSKSQQEKLVSASENF